MSTTASLDVGGVGLELRSWPGRGLPILLLHEGLGSVSLWRDFPERLARATGHEVIAWSRQGYGQSDPLPHAYDCDYMHREAAILPALMDALECPRAHCLGHSDGGSIALIAAARSPARVASLILEAPHVLVEDLTVRSIAQVKTAYAAGGLAGKLQRHHRDADQAFWRWNDIWLDPRFLAWNIEDLLPAIHVPALLIQGFGDEYGTLDQLDRLQAVLPTTRRLELAACGHAPHRDQPEAVLAATRTFIRDVDP